MKRILLSLAVAMIVLVGQLRADAVADWNATAVAVSLKIPNPNRSLNHDLAYMHIAIYDAVNAIDGRYSVFAIAPSNAAPWASKEAAVAAAAHRVLLTFYAPQQPYIDSVYAAALAVLPGDSTTTRGIAIGDTVATRYLALRTGDGREASMTYTWQSPAPGVYEPTPAGAAQYQPVLPWLGHLRPFVLDSPSQFRAPGPPALSSDLYALGLNEVKRYGSKDSTYTTPQQREIARFHTENPNTLIARNIRQFAASRGMSLADNARLFAQLYATLCDALTTGFESKYFFNYWRPVTSIRAADTDGNAFTDRDTSWQTLVTTPTHPEYPAAHGCGMGGLAFGLEQFFGTPNVSFTLTSTATGTQHAFANTNELLAEVVNARVWGGMHYRTSVEDGIDIGRNVAAVVAEKFARVSSPWIAQPSGLGATTLDMEFAAVNENVSWGVKTVSAEYIRTTDGGEHWSPSAVTGASGLQGSSVAARDADMAWVAMRDPTNATSGGVFQTTDGGSGWTKQTSAFPAAGGEPLIIHFFDSNAGVCIGNPHGGYWEIYTTTNGGTLWTRVPSLNIPAPLGDEGGFSGDFSSVGNSLWFGTSSTRLYRTTDRGMTWVVRGPILAGDNGFSMSFKDSQHGLACTFIGGNQVSKTTDRGDTWTPVAVPSGISAYFMASAPGTPGSYVITSENTFGGIPGSAHSLDDGASWTVDDNVSHAKARFVSARLVGAVGQITPCTNGTQISW